jgi:hypothetical protein
VALVGLGGAGKTALAARFLAELLGPVPTGLARPSGLFVWSFYQQPDAGLFLREAHRYFAGDSVASASPARGAGLLHLLREALSTGGPHLLVLDGLERVQQQDGHVADAGAGAHGRIEDPLLRGLLTRIAEGTGQTTALVTSRFPLTDLEPYRGRGYSPLDVGGLGREAAVDLLRRRGVLGDDRALAALVDAYGAHALTLDHLGGLIGQFLGGDPSRAPEAPSLASPGGDRQALRLARLMRAYEEHLPEAELALLCRLCLLRNSVTEDQIVRLFVGSPAVQPRSAREAAEVVERLTHLGGFSPAECTSLFDAARAAMEEAIASAPLAGPDDGFPEEVRKTVEEVLPEGGPSEEDIDELIKLYDDTPPTEPTDRRPLPAEDAGPLQYLIGAYRELRVRSASLYQTSKPHDPLKEMFDKFGWSLSQPNPSEKGPPEPEAYVEWVFKKYGWESQTRAPEDITAENIAERLSRVRLRLRWLAAKHAVLARVREVCRLRQRKWALAGPLAALDAGAVRKAVAALADRHLVVREADGSVGVHPAVRDHFARLGAGTGAGTEGSGWHDLIREQLVSLARRPGRGLPEDKATLDLVEEAIHHALEAGREIEARELYERCLGGLRHLGWKLGETARGLRVLRGFRACPDRSALGWFLRALGELDEAYRANPMGFFRADVRLLQGRLPEVAREGDSVRATTAAFLMGDCDAGLPPDALGPAVPRVQLLLFQGRLRQAWHEGGLCQLYREIGWEGDRARLQLLLAEVERRQADLDACGRSLEGASGWVLRSGSVEHLCLMHLVRARLDRDSGDLRAARRAADEGVHTAGQCGLGLYHVLLLNARAEVLGRSEPEASERSAREALALASAPGCSFLWGAGEAGHLLGQALAAQWRFAEARAALSEALSVRERLGDPATAQTARMLERLPS